MPIYAYKCSSCGHAKDVLQKISDAPLTVCTACGAETFSKQVTAAGFQLKGSGWYVTDFRGGNTGSTVSTSGSDSSSGTQSDTPAEKSASSAPKTEAASPAAVNASAPSASKSSD